MPDLRLEWQSMKAWQDAMLLAIEDGDEVAAGFCASRCWHHLRRHELLTNTALEQSWLDQRTADSHYYPEVA